MNEKDKPVEFRPITPGAVFPTPRNLSAEETARILDQVKAEFDPVACEAEFAELLRQHEAGELESGDELLAELEAEFEDEQDRK